MVLRAKIRPALPEDIEYILPNCSETELRTLTDLYGDSPEALLRVAIYEMKVWTGLIDNRPVCFFGTHSPNLLSDTVYVWLLGSRELRNNPILFMKCCKPVLEKITEGYSVVKSTVDLRNDKASRLAKKLGFIIAPTPSWSAGIELRRH